MLDLAEELVKRDVFLVYCRVLEDGLHAIRQAGIAVTLQTVTDPISQDSAARRADVLLAGSVGAVCRLEEVPVGGLDVGGHEDHVRPIDVGGCLVVDSNWISYGCCVTPYSKALSLWD